MPPKKTTKKILQPSPSGRGCGPTEDHEGPAPAQPEVQGDQDPLRKNDDDQDISFDGNEHDDEHDDKANPKHEETKGDEERVQLTNDEISDETLAATCFSGLGVSQDTQNLMTPGQRGDLIRLMKILVFSASACLPLVVHIKLAVPKPTPTKSRSSADLQRALDKAKENSRSFDVEKVAHLTKLLLEGVVNQELTFAINACLPFEVQSIVNQSADVFATEQGAAIQVVPLIQGDGNSSSWNSTSRSVYNSYNADIKVSSWGDEDESSDEEAGPVKAHHATLISNHRRMLPTLFEYPVSNLCDVIQWPGDLPSVHLRTLLADINSATLEIMLAHDAIPEAYNMALELMNVRQVTVLSLLSAALERVRKPWAQILSSKYLRASRNQIGFTAQFLNPSLAIVTELRRRFANVAGVYAVHALVMGLPPSSMGTSRGHLKAILDTPVPAAGVGAVLGHLTSSIESGRASIPANLPPGRAKIWTGVFADAVMMEIVGSALQNAYTCPSIGNDFKAQQQWTTLGDEVRDYIKESDASLPGLLSLVESFARKGHCAPSIGYNAEDWLEKKSFALLSQDDESSEQHRVIHFNEAGEFLYKYQQGSIGPPIAERICGSYRLKTGKDGNPVTLRGDTWRDLPGFGKAFVYAMRKQQTSKRSGNSGGNKTTEKPKPSARQRIKIAEELEEPVVKSEVPPSSLPGLKNMDQSGLSEMIKTLKAQAECMARAQALQPQENARIMSSIGFLTESLAADDNLGSTN